MSYIEEFKRNNPWCLELPVLEDNKDLQDIVLSESPQVFITIWDDTDVGLEDGGALSGWLGSRRHTKAEYSTLFKYLKDFTHPTTQEKEMFHMLFGWEIPWSEECPLVL